MNILSLFAGIAFAAETVLSPIPDHTPVVVPPPPKPDISFGQIVAVPTPLLAISGATPQVLGTATETTKKKSYTIAFLGDSMIDTMGPGLPDIYRALRSRYPQTTFTLLNYGVGATNIEYGITRITNSYDYLGARIPSLASMHPDIVVLESFAYNPFPDADGGVNRHWQAMAHAVDTLKQSIPGVTVVIAATIAPHTSDVISQSHAAVITSYLESTIAFAKGEHIPLADAYHPSGGNIQYINPGDHIHYSDAGRALFARIVVSTLSSVL